MEDSKPNGNRRGQRSRQEILDAAAKVMAVTAVDLIRNPELIAAAKADHTARLEDTPFVNPIPDDVDPPFPAAAMR